jgi:ubiquinone/menaquinone biosynthesis C-methylase UbiE
MVGDISTFDRFARLYDLAMPGAKTAALERALDRARRPVDRLLDVGGGSGRAARSVGVTCRVVVDPAAGMVQQARRNGLDAVRGDGARLPVADGTVDAVLIVDALHHVQEQQSVLAESYRVLRDGGVLVVREFDPTTLRGRGLVAAEALVGFDSTFHSPARLAARIDAAGFGATVVDSGFGYTAVGLVESETHNTTERLD